MSDELPHELADLFRAERTAPRSDVGVRSAVRVKLATTVGASGLALATALKGLAVLAVIVAIGAVALRTMPERQGPSRPTRQVDVPNAPDLHPPVMTPAAPPVPAPAPSVATTPRALRKPARVSPAIPAAAPPAESTLIRDAWLALSASDPQRALGLVREDMQLHPDGVLDEERRAIEIIALARTGHVDEARAAVVHFDAEYPASVHRALIAQSLSP